MRSGRTRLHYVVPLVAWALAAAGGLAADAAATPGWTAATPLSPAGTAAGFPSIALDAGGSGDVIWSIEGSADGLIVTSHRPAGGEWSTSQNLSGFIPLITNARWTPEIVSNARGDAAAVWAENLAGGGTAVVVRTRQAGRPWRDVVPLTGAGGSRPRIAINSAGKVVVVWLFGTDRVQVREGSVSGAWAPTVPLAQIMSTSGPSVFPTIALNDRGDALAAWLDGLSIMASSRVAGADWGLPTPAVANKVLLDPTETALDPFGTGTVVSAYPGPMLAITRPAGGSWPQPGLSEDGAFPDVAYDAAGNATVAWSPPGAGGFVKVATRPRGGSWSAAVPLGRAHDTRLALAVNRAGDAVVAWVHRADFGGGPLLGIQAAVRRAGGSWSQPKIVTAAGQIGEIPTAAIDAAGDAVVAWESANRVYYAAYDQSGPALRTLQFPTRGTANAPLTFAVSPLDTWSGLGATTWSFGDGTAATGNRVAHTFSAPGSYVATLTARDRRGNVTVARRTIAVAPTPKAGVVTGAPRQVTRTSARLTATIRPTLLPLTYWFEWGRTRALGRRTPVRALPAGGPPRSVAAQVSGLTPGTRYYFRVAASYCRGCAVGTARGAIAPVSTDRPRKVDAVLDYFMPIGQSERFSRMNVKHVPKRARIRFRCAGSCGLRSWNGRGRGTVAIPPAIGPRFGSGARILITVRKPRWVGTWFSMRMRAGRSPTFDKGCIRLNGKRTDNCSSL
jgi:hypothetical protein